MHGRWRSRLCCYAPPHPLKHQRGALTRSTRVRARRANRARKKRSLKGCAQIHQRRRFWRKRRNEVRRESHYGPSNSPMQAIFAAKQHPLFASRSAAPSPLDPHGGRLDETRPAGARNHPELETVPAVALWNGVNAWAQGPSDRRVQARPRGSCGHTARAGLPVPAERIGPVSERPGPGPMRARAPCGSRCRAVST